jgi:predicted dehydrogenase
MTMRIAVIGAGLIGRKHLSILKNDPAFEVAGIADPSPQAAVYGARTDLSISPIPTNCSTRRNLMA